MTLLPPGRRLAEATPATRSRFLDALRTGSLLLVVLGHGLMLTMTYWPLGGTPLVGNTLDSFPALMPATWLLQPMSLFFFAGAAANVAAYASATAKGGDYHSWLWARVRRLYRPVLFYLAVMVPLAVVVSLLAGPSGGVLLMGITGLFWFIAVYTAATALLPALGAWTARQPWAPLVVLCAVVAGVDLVKRGLSLPDAVGLPNIFLVWLVFTQLGVMYRVGLLSRAVAGALAVGGLAAMLVCVYALGYPVSMVGTASGPSNTVPPTVALMFQGLFLIGLVVLAERPITRWLSRPRVWIATCTASACAMTVYLWHLPALIVTLAIVHYAGWFPDAVAQA
ncbi:MAG TPA: acyltransferase family protein, partial [Casimicrobiaceae bacterium]